MDREEALKEAQEKLEKILSQDKLSPVDEKEVKKLKEVILRIEKSKYYEGEFEPDFAQLYMMEPFLGGISVSVSKRADFSVPTAYVGIRKVDNSHDVVMGFNPSFFRSLSKKQRQGVIRHELYHLVFQHIFARSIGDPALAKLWNWATDLAINSIIGLDNLPDMCLVPGHRNMDPQTGKPVEGIYADYIANAKPMQASDHYFHHLLELMKENNHDEQDLTIGTGGGGFDDHSQWDDIPSEVQEEIRERVRGMIEEGVMRADQNNSWGNTPQEIQDYIRKMLSREIDWRSIVKSFFGRVRSQERSSTMKRINKKMPYVHPGVKRKFKSTFACFIDQSGSMSDKDIAMLFGELEGLAKETEIDVFHFDTEVDVNSKTVWKKGKPFPKPHRTRCGGTDFDCVANYCNNPKNPSWSGVVILTDGYAPTMGAIKGSKVMWVVTETGTMEHIRPGDLAVQMKKDQGKFKTY